MAKQDLKIVMKILILILSTILILHGSIVYADMSEKEYKEYYDTNSEFREIEDSLNKIWGELKSSLQKDQYEKLLRDQQRWLKVRGNKYDLSDHFRYGATQYIEDTCIRVANLLNYKESYNNKKYLITGKLSFDGLSEETGPALFLSKNYKIGNSNCDVKYLITPIIPREKLQNSAFLKIINNLADSNKDVTVNCKVDLPTDNLIVKDFTASNPDIFFTSNDIQEDINNYDTKINDELCMEDGYFPNGLNLRWRKNLNTGVTEYAIQSKEDDIVIEGYKINRGNTQSMEQAMSGKKFKYKPTELKFGQQIHIFTLSPYDNALEVRICTNKGGVTFNLEDEGKK